MKEEGFLSCQTQEAQGDSLSLDLPDESWDGEPNIDRMYVEIQWAHQVTKLTYDLLQEKKERPTCKFDLAEIMDSSPEHDLSEFCAEFIGNKAVTTEGNDFVSVSYSNGRCGGNTTREISSPTTSVKDKQTINQKDHRPPKRAASHGSKLGQYSTAKIIHKESK